MGYADLMNDLGDTEVKGEEVAREVVDENMRRLLHRHDVTLLQTRYGLGSYTKSYTPQEIVEEADPQAQVSTVEILVNMAFNKLREKLAAESVH